MSCGAMDANSSRQPMKCEEMERVTFVLIQAAMMLAMAEM